ncbi:hypothetical protein ACFOVU_20340 [Nocardiopsis sediminis]|uniref:DUF4365 domain-containing protein n=1 Tax=Nocardiopsis sediminis TaxID=1778267 RepID=A0ABV8FQ41_9ACTN
MPSKAHEFPLDLIRHKPDIAVDLLSVANTSEFPKFAHVRCESGDATTTVPAELRCDSVVVCEDSDRSPALAIITENQLGRDDDKRFSWPQYVANIRARLRCPVALLVLTPNDRIATWCETPIELGCGHIRPSALSLTALKPFTDPEQAIRHPEMAILALASNPTDDTVVLKALAPAMRALKGSPGAVYADYLLAALPAAAKKYLEDAVKQGTYEYQTELFRAPYLKGQAEGRAEGKAEGEAHSIFLVLAARGIDVPDAVCERINACTDIPTLNTWVSRAATVNTIEELFG